MSRRSRRRFDALVADALDELPGWVQEAMDNVAVVVDDHPPSDDADVLGLYEGIAQTERFDYAGALPDRITLFRSTIEAEAGDDDDELRAVVAETVVHEVAHHFGISDERLEALGWD
ncbi:MAG TPA: metallopeptidase family protein [Actinomycetota bacterium]|nr:metallopeptidase family protein [Actinomycetota bacterium]